jgi:hypothetical protein
MRLLPLEWARARMAGHTWTACPSCGRMFGAHERGGKLWTSINGALGTSSSQRTCADRACMIEVEVANERRIESWARAEEARQPMMDRQRHDIGANLEFLARNLATHVLNGVFAGISPAGDEFLKMLTFELQEAADEIRGGPEPRVDNVLLFLGGARR